MELAHTPDAPKESYLSKRILIACLSLLIFFTIGTAQTKPRRAVARAPVGGGATETVLKKLERDWFDAVAKNDAETLNKIFADDFIATNSDGGFVDKAEMVKTFSSGRFKLDEIKSDEFKLRQYGLTTAVVTGRSTYIRDGKELGQSSHTEVWVKRAGLWQAVLWTSIPLKKSILGAKAMTTDSGLKYEDIVAGTGESPKTGQQVTVHYTGTLEDGRKFDSSVDRGQPFTFTIGVGQVIKGWDEGVMSMKVGGKRKLVIPPNLGYGARGAGGVIPPNATLVFDVELLGIQ